MLREEFDKAFNTLCKKKSNWTHVPTVSNILLQYHREFISEKTTILQYFIQEFGNGRDTTEIKFQEFINFIRLERNKKFNVNFRIHNRKFISNSCGTRCVLKRSHSLWNYYTEYVMLQNSIPYTGKWWR